MMRFGVFVMVLSLLCGCSQMHQAQVGNIDSQAVLNGRRFELLISETGMNLDQAAGAAEIILTNAQIAEQVARQTGTDAAKILSVNKEVAGATDIAGDILSLFQMGPTTGNPVFDEAYADVLFELLHAECPSGRISGLTSIRESAYYPVLGSEVIKLVGYCVE